MKNKSCLFMLVCAVSLLASANARTSRDLVFDDEGDVPATASQDVKDVAEGVQKVAVKTTVVLNRDGQVSTVLPSHEFKSGDKVKIVFTPSIDGYVYWLAKGSSGSYTLLYPNPKSGMDNRVVRNQEYNVPAKGSFKFDNNAGSEELLCLLSTTPMPELDNEAKNQFKNSASVDAVQTKRENRRKSRDLVFDDEDENVADVNTVTQSNPVGEPFVAKYELRHM